MFLVQWAYELHGVNSKQQSYPQDST